MGYVPRYVIKPCSDNPSRFVVVDRATNKAVGNSYGHGETAQAFADYQNTLYMEVGIPDGV